MKTLDFTPFTEEQFQRLAMHKARGQSWDDIATDVNLPVETIERVAWTHEKQWERTLTKAERQVARETLGEVVNTLRKDLRNADSKARPTIANSLSRALKQQQEFAPKKRPRPVVGPVAAATPSEPTKPVEPPLLSPLPPLAPLPPLTPMLPPEEERARFHRARAIVEAACGLVLVFLCFCWSFFGRALPVEDNEHTMVAVVRVESVPTRAIAETPASAPPDRGAITVTLPPTLAPPWHPA